MQMNKSKKLIMLSIIFILMHTSNSFGMLRALTQRTPQLNNAKFKRPITCRLGSENRKRMLAAAEKLNEDCNTNIPRNEEILGLIQSHISLSKDVQHLNIENIAILKKENPEGTYNVHSLGHKLELLSYIKQHVQAIQQTE